MRMTPGRDTAPGFFVIVFIVPALFFIVIADAA